MFDFVDRGFVRIPDPLGKLFLRPAPFETELLNDFAGCHLSAAFLLPPRGLRELRPPGSDRPGSEQSITIVKLIIAHIRSKINL